MNPQPQQGSSPAESPSPKANSSVAGWIVGGAMGLLVIVGVVALLIAMMFKASTEVAGNPPAPRGDAVRGKTLYIQSCISCHGPTGAGMPMQGGDIVHSDFVMKKTDQELADFIKRGRTPEDPESTMQLLMPPNGGNFKLTDADRLDIVAYLRTLNVGKQTKK
jgi:mono/diheme cytochrome c family protein